MPGLSERERTKIREAFERAAIDAGYRMKVRATFTDKLEFSDFAQDMATGLVLNEVARRASDLLKQNGIKFSIGTGSGGFLDDIKPDRYTLITDGKTVYGAMTWEF